MSSDFAINGDIQRKMRKRGVARAGKRFTWVIWNRDMDDGIRIVQSLESSGVLVELMINDY